MWRAALGIGVSILALALLLRSVDLGETIAALRTADVRWILLLLVCLAVDVAFRAVRWRVLLSPIADVPPGKTLASLLVGYLANNVLPARLGELVRSHDLGERTGLSRSTILGTIVVERVVDTIVVVAIAALAILVLSVRGVVASAVLVGLAASVLLLLGLAAGIAAHRLPGAGWIIALVDRWPRIRQVLARLHDGMAVAARPRPMAIAVALSVASWSATVFAFVAAAQSVGVGPTMSQAALLAAGTNLATAIPAAPGYIGTFELAATTIATSVAIAPAPALAFALLVHAGTLFLTSVGGALALATRRRAPLSPAA